MLVAGGGHERDAVVVRVLGGRGEDRRTDERLLGDLLGGHRARDVVGERRAVVEPRVGEEAHVHDVEAEVARLGEGGDGLEEEEEAGVLTGPQVDQGDVGSHAGDADAVAGGGDGAGDVRAVATVVDVGRVDAGRRTRRDRRSPGCPS